MIGLLYFMSCMIPMIPRAVRSRGQVEMHSRVCIECYAKMGIMGGRCLGGNECMI